MRQALHPTGGLQKLSRAAPDSPSGPDWCYRRNGTANRAPTTSFAKRSLEPHCEVGSDGLAYFAAVIDAGGRYALPEPPSDDFACHSLFLFRSRATE